MSGSKQPKPLLIVSIVLRLAVAGIFLMMAFTKLTGQPDARWIFEQVGLGDAGMYATGAAELVAAVLLLVPKTTVYGALLAMLVVLGAIGSHLTKLGISPVLPSTKTPEMPQGQGDPSMFGMAVAVLVFSVVIVLLNRRCCCSKK